MRILRFDKFKLLELHQMKNVLPQNKVYTFLITDENGKNTIDVKLTNYGWSLHREIIYYEFTVVESNYSKYNEGGMMILGLEFDDRENSFYFYPYYNDTGKNKMNQTNQLRYKANIKII